MRIKEIRTSLMVPEGLVLTKFFRSDVDVDNEFKAKQELKVRLKDLNKNIATACVQMGSGCQAPSRKWMVPGTQTLITWRWLF